MKSMSFLMCIVSLFIGLVFGSHYYHLSPLHPVYSSARAVMHPTSGNQVRGVVNFKQVDNGIHITAELQGLTPGKHGFHVHEYGDCTSVDGMCTGGHFNPTGASHGSPADSDVHIGDLGNIVADENGNAQYDEINHHVKLFGPHSIVGRALIVHADPDDLHTQPTGNSGKRIGCGVIGIIE